MNHKSEVSPKDHKHDDHLNKESADSPRCHSDGLEYDNKLMLIEKKENIKMIGLKDEEKEDRFSDSKESEDNFLECESDVEFANDSENHFFNNIQGSNVCKESEVLDKKSLYLNAVKNFNVKNLIKSHSYHCFPSNFNGFEGPNGHPLNSQTFVHGAQYGSISNQYYHLNPELLSLHNQGGGYSPAFQGQFIDPELVQDRTMISKSFLSRESRKGSRDRTNDIPNLQNDNSASDSIYEDFSDIPSEVNSELESRIIEFHEAKKSLTTSENGDIAEGANRQDSSSLVYEPEDEIDELFDRVINCEYDPDFTFIPVALDPYVKISNKLIAKRSKRYPRHMANAKSSKKSSGGSSSSSSSSCSGECGHKSSNQKGVNSKVKIKTNEDKSSLSYYVPGDSSAAKNGLVSDESHEKHTNNSADNKIGDRINVKDIDEYKQVVRLDTKIEPSVNFHDVQEYDSTDSEVEKQKERARVLFEATKKEDQEPYSESDDEDLSPNIKNLKLSKKSSEDKSKSDKKSKKSKHKSDQESEDEKVSKSDKKSDKKSSKSSKHNNEADNDKDIGKLDKSDPEKGGKTDKTEVEKAEKGDKSEKHKDKKSEKIKKVSWKSTDYDMIFNNLGECFSSGHIGHDTNPIVLNRKGFYTLFFRNSKYPYDSNIDFYLFRIGFKYSLVNEPKGQAAIIGI
eukprot:XP_766569.1 hypothetical protein [Theileria parva strain Muguga]